MKTAFVYILANKKYGTLYIGVTSNLHARIINHRISKQRTFVQKYKVFNLVYYEECNLITQAIQREKNIKNWKRSWKIELIEKENPRWRNLFE